MPRVDTYGAPKVAPRPVSGVRRTGPAGAAETFASEGGQIGQAMAGLGDQVARIGIQGATEIWRVQQERADEAAVMGATRALGQLEESLLKDPQSGALNVKGKDTLQLRSTVSENYDQAADVIAGHLTNDRQRLAFDRERLRRRESMLETVDTHTLREVDAYETGEAKASLDSAVNLAIANADNPARIAEELDRMEAIVTRSGPRLGLTGPMSKENAVAALRGKVHEGVITQLLVRDQDQRATEYYEEVKDQIPGEQRPQIEAQLQNASTDATALRAAGDIWTELGPTTDQAPINLDAMEARARALYGDNPKVLKATIGYLRDRMQGVTVGRKERLDARDDVVWSAVLNGQSFLAVRRMPEFLQLEGKDQAAIRDYYTRQIEHQANVAYQNEARAAARESREYTRQLRVEKQVEMEHWADYYQLSDPARLRTMSRADILRQLPTVGREHVNRLLTDQEQLQRSDAAVRAATVDNDLFKSVAADAGLTYVNKTPGQQSVAQRANLGKLRATVEEEIARQQTAKNRVLSYEEKQQVMRQIVDQKVTIDRAFWYGGDQETIAAIVNEQDRANAYVPIDQVPASATTDYANYLRGELPGLARMSLPEITARYGQRFERAYALRLLGASRQEIEAALKGRP